MGRDLFSTQTNELHILAFSMLHQHIYKGKRKLQLPITCETFVLFELFQFLFCFVNILFRKCGKCLQSAEMV